eukprot:PhF_6_TR2248/c0_g1_i2/m.3836
MVSVANTWIGAVGMLSLLAFASFYFTSPTTIAARKSSNVPQTSAPSDEPETYTPKPKSISEDELPEIHLLAFLDRNYTTQFRYGASGTCNFVYSALLNGYKNISLFGYQTSIRRAREKGPSLMAYMSYPLKHRLDKLVLFADLFDTVFTRPMKVASRRYVVDLGDPTFMVQGDVTGMTSPDRLAYYEKFHGAKNIDRSKTQGNFFPYPNGGLLMARGDNLLQANQNFFNHSQAHKGIDMGWITTRIVDLDLLRKKYVVDVNGAVSQNINTAGWRDFSKPPMAANKRIFYKHHCWYSNDPPSCIDHGKQRCKTMGNCAPNKKNVMSCKTMSSIFHFSGGGKVWVGFVHETLQRHWKVTLRTLQEMQSWPIQVYRFHGGMMKLTVRDVCPLDRYNYKKDAPFTVVEK